MTKHSINALKTNTYFVVGFLFIYFALKITMLID